jgi:hypothetical protein
LESHMVAKYNTIKLGNKADNGRSHGLMSTGVQLCQLISRCILLG